MKLELLLVLCLGHLLQAKCPKQIPGMVLFGGPMGQTLSKNSKQACISACKGATEFKCKAANYYPVRKQCLLYEFNSIDRPDRVIDANPGQKAVILNVVC